LQNEQLAMSIEILNVITNFKMLIFQFALICKKGLGRGQSHASAVTSPALSPAPLE
jgi:hypothetical protein